MSIVIKIGSFKVLLWKSLLSQKAIIFKPLRMPLNYLMLSSCERLTLLFEVKLNVLIFINVKETIHISGSTVVK